MKILTLIYKIFFLLVVIPSLLALVSAVGFWVIYLSLTSPVLAKGIAGMVLAVNTMALFYYLLEVWAKEELKELDDKHRENY